MLSTEPRSGDHIIFLVHVISLSKLKAMYHKKAYVVTENNVHSMEYSIITKKKLVIISFGINMRNDKLHY